jgi:hypothetical protein
MPNKSFSLNEKKSMKYIGKRGEKNLPFFFWQPRGIQPEIISSEIMNLRDEGLASSSRMKKGVG